MWREKLQKFLVRTLLIIIAIIVIFIVNGYFEKVIVVNEIEDFKSRAEYIGIDPIYSNIHYYKVEKKYDYEEISRHTFDLSDKKYIGAKTDILVTNRNPLRGVSVLEPLIGYLSLNFFVGHASINSTDDGAYMYEVVGNSDIIEENQVIESMNDWVFYLRDIESPIIVGLRIKDTTAEQRNKMIEYTAAQTGKGYNYTFLFNRNNTFYCTDLVSRAVKYAGININYDYFTTTGNDMMVSKNTYIFFLREVIYEDGKPQFNVYFLEDEV
jgi:hypothetical protein